MFVNQGGRAYSEENLAKELKDGEEDRKKLMVCLNSEPGAFVLKQGPLCDFVQA